MNTSTTLKKLVIVLCMALVMLPQTAFAGTATKDIASCFSAGSHVTFGSYPQTEIVDAWYNSGAAFHEWESEYVVDEALYVKLQSAYWDANGDAVIDGNKYHRLFKSDATHVDVEDSENYDFEHNFSWDYDCTVKYFRYDPIEWEVKRVNSDNTITLMADKALDCQSFNTTRTTFNWNTSSLRAWLNGAFYNRAFSSEERSYCVSNNLGNGIYDNVFILSKAAAANNTNGFSSDPDMYDWNRRTTSSTYAKAMGCYVSNDEGYGGNCCWWLRTQSTANKSGAAYVRPNGSINATGVYVDHTQVGVRPCVCISLDSNELVKTKINLSHENVTYDGTPKKPTVNMGSLNEGRDYKVKYINNINPGTATVIVNGIGDYSGTLKGTFTIQPFHSASGSMGYSYDMDTIYYGNYPQTEIVDKASRSGAYGKKWSTASDYEVDASLYAKLQDADWNDNNDVTVDGVKYHLIDDLYSDYNDPESYNWGNVDERYFRYEPIKWIVVKKNGTKATVIAEKALDADAYKMSSSKLTWTQSDTRAWCRDTFLKSAFSTTEKGYILTTALKDTSTSDKVYLMSEDEMLKNGYGGNLYRAKSTTYAKARFLYSDCNAETLGNCWWWLRTPGLTNGSAIGVLSDGFALQIDSDIVVGLRPMMQLELKGNKGIVNGDIFENTNDNVEAYTESDVYEYTGEEVKPEVVVEKVPMSESEDFIVLEENKDYELSYSNNIEPGIGRITVKGIGDYRGEWQLAFSIVDMSLNEVNGDISSRRIVLDKTTYIHNGTECKPVVSIEGLVENEDFTVEYSNNVEVGKAKVTVTGIGDYNGTATASFNITHDIVDHKAVDSTCTASGNNAYETCAVEGCDYTTYDASTLIKAKGHTMTAHEAKAPTCTLEGNNAYWVCNTCKKVYADQSGNTETSVEDCVLGKRSHNYQNRDAKKASLTESGYSSYKECSMCHDITDKNEIAQIDDASITLEENNYAYDGDAKEPKVTVCDKNGELLSEGSDYTVEYVDNTNAGTAKAIITFKGKYEGETEKLFGITATKLEGYELVLEKTSYDYNGKAIEAGVVVQDGDGKVFDSSNYEVSYSDNDKPGIATVVVNFKGNYSGTLTAEYEILCLHDNATKHEETDSTCVVPGNTEYWSCDDCGKFFAQKPDKNSDDMAEGSWVKEISGHKTEVVNIRESTCTAEGYTGDTVCIICNTTVANGEKLAKLVHKPVKVAQVNATCQRTGLKAHYMCKNCHKMYTDAAGKKATTEAKLLINKVAHSYTDKVVTGEYLKSAATCTDKANYYYACKYCGLKGTKTYTNGNALGHKLGAVIPQVSATCERSGMKGHYICERCSKWFSDSKAKKSTTEKSSTIKKLSHSYTRKVVSSEYLKSAATCTAKATYYYACKTCDNKGTKTYTVGNALGHNLHNVVEKYATMTTDGKYHSECQRCSYKSKSAVVYKASKITLNSTPNKDNPNRRGVTVKDSKGKAITSSANYTVSYGVADNGKHYTKIRWCGLYKDSDKTFYY